MMEKYFEENEIDINSLNMLYIEDSEKKIKPGINKKLDEELNEEEFNEELMTDENVVSI